MVNRAAAQLNVSVSQGDERMFVLRRKSPSGQAIDQTGMDAGLELLSRSSGTVVCTLSTTDGGIDPLDATGEIRIDLQYADYVALDPGQYELRLDLIEAGRRRPYLRGTWSILK